MRRQLEPLLGDTSPPLKRFVLLSNHTANIITQCSQLWLCLPTILLGFLLLGAAAPPSGRWVYTQLGNTLQRVQTPSALFKLKTRLCSLNPCQVKEKSSWVANEEETEGLYSGALRWLLKGKILLTVDQSQMNGDGLLIWPQGCAVLHVRVFTSFIIKHHIY